MIIILCCRSRPSSSDDEVTDCDIALISSEIPPDQYFQVGTSLGLTIGRLQHIENRCLYSRVGNPFVEVLNIWKNERIPKEATKQILNSTIAPFMKKKDQDIAYGG